MSKKRGVYFFERYESPGFEELLKRARVRDVVVVATMTVCFSINVKVFCETQTCFVTNTKIFMETETSVTEQTKIVIDLSLGVQTNKRGNGAFSSLRKSVDSDVRKSLNNIQTASFKSHPKGKMIGGALRDPLVLKKVEQKERARQQTNTTPVAQTPVVGTIPFSKFVAPPPMTEPIPVSKDDKPKFLDNYKRATVAAKVETNNLVNAMSDVEFQMMNTHTLSSSQVFVERIKPKMDRVEKILQESQGYSITNGSSFVNYPNEREYFLWLTKLFEYHTSLLKLVEAVKQRKSGFFKDDSARLSLYVDNLFEVYKTLDDKKFVGLEGKLAVFVQYVLTFLSTPTISSLDSSKPCFTSLYEHILQYERNGAYMYFGHIRKSFDDEEDIIEVADNLEHVCGLLCKMAEDERFKFSLPLKNFLKSRWDLSKRAQTEMKKRYHIERKEEDVDYTEILSSCSNESPVSTVVVNDPKVKDYYNRYFEKCVQTE